MSKVIMAIFVALVAVSVCGCGGSSTNGNNGQETDIRIDPNGVFPLNIAVRIGDRATWINTTSDAQTVTSGTLEKVSFGQRKVAGRILIEQNNTFVPDYFEANFGDTIEWQNNRTAAFVLEIVDESGTVVTTISFDVGQVIGFANFPRAGTYTARQQGMPLISGQVRLYGVPKPDGAFVNTLLTNGSTFTRPFPSGGVFNYYVVTAGSANNVFLNGKVTVQ